MTARQTELAASVLGALTAVNACAGAVYGMRGAPAVPREWLEGSGLRDYSVPSAVLGLAVGGSSAVAAVSAWRGSDRAPIATVAAGGVLTAWIVVQVGVIGLRSPLQPIMGAAGIALIGLGRRMS